MHTRQNPCEHGHTTASSSSREQMAQDRELATADSAAAEAVAVFALSFFATAVGVSGRNCSCDGGCRPERFPVRPRTVSAALVQAESYEYVRNENLENMGKIRA